MKQLLLILTACLVAFGAGTEVQGQVGQQTQTKIAAAPTKLEEHKVLSVTPIPETDPLIVALKKNPELGHVQGLNWRAAKRVVYQGTNIAAILVPISANKTLVAYYRNGKPDFKLAIMETTGPGFKSGQLNFSTTDGKQIVGHTFQNNSMELTSVPVKTASYWDCVADCHKGALEGAPSWVKVATSVPSPFETGVKAGALLGCGAYCW